MGWKTYPVRYMRYRAFAMWTIARSERETCNSMVYVAEVLTTDLLERCNVKNY